MKPIDCVRFSGEVLTLYISLVGLLANPPLFNYTLLNRRTSTALALSNLTNLPKSHHLDHTYENKHHPLCNSCSTCNTPSPHDQPRPSRRSPLHVAPSLAPYLQHLQHSFNYQTCNTTKQTKYGTFCSILHINLA